MLEFSCPRCSCAYHADEEHLGKHIRCTNCGDLVPIRLQDGRYDHSARPIEHVNAKKVNVEPVAKYASSRQPRRRSLGSRIELFASLFLILLIGAIGLLIVRESPKLPAERASRRPESARPAAEAATPTPESIPSSSDVPQTHNNVFDQNSYNLFDQPDTIGSVPTRGVPASNTPVTLSAGDIETGCESNPTAHPLPNGAQIIPDVVSAGHGEIEAFNGTGNDAYLNVVDVQHDRKVRQRFIRWGKSVTIDQLSPGQYRLVFSTGYDWDDATKEFSSEVAYFEVGKNLEFEERYDSDALHYDHHSITLNPVPHGNVNMVHLSRAEFKALSGKQ